jgi:hypothetical protein
MVYTETSPNWSATKDELNQSMEAHRFRRGRKRWACCFPYTLRGNNMGMDVFGRNPSAERGQYFRANIWSWSPIYELTVSLCKDLLDHETICDMAFNNGAGPEDGQVCLAMAGRVDEWLEAHHEDEVSVGIANEEGGPRSQLMGDAMAAALGLVPEYSTDRAHLQGWVAFLRDCGGFEVW